MTTPTLRIGARGSRLSLRQTQIVVDLLSAAWPGTYFEVVVISTTGDQRLDTPLPLIGGKGVFTEEIEAALLDGSIDFAVHSLKDLPVENRFGITVGAVPERGAVEDILISRSGCSFGDLPRGAVIGTSSLRRGAQLLTARPDLRPESIRGNVETRIKKALDPAGPYEAIVLAKAGIDRLDLSQIDCQTLSLDLMLPAPGQGALAVQCRDDAESRQVLAPINHPATEWATLAERGFLDGLGGGCSTPVAAYGSLAGSALTLRGRVSAVDGSRTIDVEMSAECDSAAAADEIGRLLASEALSLGAGDLIGLPS